MIVPGSPILTGFIGFIVGSFISLSSVQFYPYLGTLRCHSSEVEYTVNTVNNTENDVTATNGDEKETPAVELSRPVVFNDTRFHEGDNNSIAEQFYQDIRILCLVMTHKINHRFKAIPVKATWGGRCNKLLFVTRTADENLPTLIIDVEDGRDKLPNKTRATFDKVFTDYLHDFEWFLKADDDTYVIMENLRYFLSEKDHNSPVYFGQKFVKFVKQGYPSGGAGYVVSREALRLFGEKNHELCHFKTKHEDLEFGRCMESLGVSFGESLDALGRTRFHCLSPDDHILGNHPEWYYDYTGSKRNQKPLEGLSDYAISFHYVSPNNMYVMEYFLYHLRPYGIFASLQNLNTNFT